MNTTQNEIAFRVFGDPKPQPRPRRRNPLGQRKLGTFNPTTANEWKFAIAIAAREHQPKEPWTGPIDVTADVYFRRPQRLCRKKDIQTRFRHENKPDRDNVDKVILDVLTACGFWVDDCQVCDGPVRKWWCALQGTSE